MAAWQDPSNGAEVVEDEPRHDVGALEVHEVAGGLDHLDPGPRRERAPGRVEHVEAHAATVGAMQVEERRLDRSEQGSRTAATAAGSSGRESDCE